MDSNSSKTIMAGALLLITLISGLFTSRAGRPLNNALFTIHKLAALSSTILVLVRIIQFYNLDETKGWIKLGAIVITGLLFLALFVTGALLSFERQWPALVLKLHQVAPPLSILATIFTFYLFIVTYK